MRIFEFQFNPKAQKDRFLKAFSFEPPPPAEAKAAASRGAVFLIGDLRNALPQNADFLWRLARVIREEYYGIEQESDRKQKKQKPQKLSPEALLKNALKKANEFLAAETKKGNVDWLGNLHCAVLLLVPGDKEHALYFAKAGAMRLYMARSSSLVDMGKSIESSAKAGDSVKVFGQIGSGKALEHDRVFVLTEELFETFAKLNLVQDVAQMRDEKQFKELFKSKEKELSKVSGILYFLFIEPLVVDMKPEKKPIALKLPPFRQWPALPKPVLALPRPQLSLPSLAISAPAPLQKKAKEQLAFFQGIPPLKKASGLFFVLAVILGIGFAILKGTTQGISPEAQLAFESAQQLQVQAEQARIVKDDKRANELLQQAFGKLAFFPDEEKLAALQKEIEKELAALNKIDMLETPEVLARVDTSQLAEPPRNFFLLDGVLYLFHPFSLELVALDPPSASQTVIQAERNLRFGGTFANTFVFFAEPNIVLSFTEAAGWEESTVSFPPGVSPQGMRTFASNMYLFDGTTGQIVKVQQGVGEPWVAAHSAKKPIDAVSIAIDGNIWVLKANGEIQRYFKGQYEESITPNIFPPLESPLKIETGGRPPFLYVLDASQQRVAVLTKFGDIIAQYKAEPFARASDFAVSADGKTIYVLAGNAVYRISGVPVES